VPSSELVNELRLEQLEQWSAVLQRWVPLSGELELPPDSVLALRLRRSRGPLPSDSLSGLVCELSGVGFSRASGPTVRL